MDSKTPSTPFVVIKLNSFRIVSPPPSTSLFSQSLADISLAQDNVDLVDEFDMTDRTDVDSEAYAMAGLVNSKPLCAFHHHCVMPSKKQSRFCFLHHQIYVRVILVEFAEAAGKTKKRKGMQIVCQESVTFHRPAAGDMAPFTLLRDISSQYEI